MDEIIIGAKASYVDFEASVSGRKPKKPKKKSIKETVPFSNVTYDFSKIDGEVYWEECELEYQFEITADTPSLLENKKRAFSNWVMNVFQEELHDPHIPKYHYLATFSDIDYADDESLFKTTATVKFTAYPYMIANEQKKYEYAVGTTEISFTVSNNSSHRIAPTFTNNVPISLTVGSLTYSISAGETTDESFKFPVGDTPVRAKSTSGSGTLKISFYEEVF